MPDVKSKTKHFDNQHLVKTQNTEKLSMKRHHNKTYRNKVGYTATLVACEWAGAVMKKKVTRVFGQER